jgi:RHS repeat-associated protein
MNYTAMTVRTAFGCAGIAEYGPTTVNLVTSITYPNGTSYSFTYEPTPGFAGNVTGRLASVTVPKGGVIQYTYSGANNGISCTDGSTLGLSRKTDDSANWQTYTRTNPSGSLWLTTVIDPLSNKTEVYFQKQSGGTQFFEVERKIFQGSSPGTLLRTTDICYSTSTGSPCTPNINTAVSLPVAYQRTDIKLDNNLISTSVSTFDSMGYPLSQSQYDYTATAMATLLRKTDYVYSDLGNDIRLLTSETIRDGSNTQIAQTTNAYDAVGSLTATSSVPQHIAVTGARGNLTSVTHWLSTGTNVTTSYSHYDTGMVRTETDPGGHTTTYGYSDSYSDLVNHNTQAFATSITKPQTGSVTHVEYRKYYWPSALPWISIDENNQSTTQSYDSSLRPTGTDYPDGGQLVNGYTDTPGSVRMEQIRKLNATPEWHRTYKHEDGYGRIKRESTMVTSGYNHVDSCFDGRGRPTFKSHPYSNASLTPAMVCSSSGDATVYDALDRMTGLVHHDSTAELIDYLGNDVRTQDEGNGSGNRVTRIRRVDALDRTTAICEVSSVTLPGTNGTPSDCQLGWTATGFRTNYSYTYDAQGLLTVSVSQAGLNTRASLFDTLGRRITYLTPEGGTTNFAYNADGLVTVRTRPRANQSNPATLTTTLYGYDALHRKTSISYDDGTATAQFFYDDATCCPYFSPALTNTKGRMVYSITNQTVEYYSYDSTGRVAYAYQAPPNVYGSTSYQLAYTYDLAGNLKTFSNGVGTTFTTNYDSASRILSLTSSLVDSTHPATLFSSPLYNAYGKLTEYVVGASIANGIKTTATYDPMGQVLTKQAKTNGGVGSVVYSLGSVTYAPNGDMTAVNDGAAAAFTYDDFRRILTATGIPSPGFEYDRYGNRTKQDGQNLGYDANNRVASGNGVTQDAVGNIRTDNNGAASYTYTYDAENRITAISGSTTATYIYDALGRRARKTVNGVSWDYVYNREGRPIAEIASTGWSRAEIYAGSMHVATYSGGVTTFIHTNRIGTARVRTDQNGTVQQNCTYQPFGDGESCTVGSGANWSPHRFADYEIDSETGLYHTWYRFYNPRLGRWMSTDPEEDKSEDPQALNLFPYVGNNPLNYTDWLGLLKSEDPRAPTDARGLPVCGRHGKFAAVGGVPGGPLPDAICECVIFFPLTYRSNCFYLCLCSDKTIKTATVSCPPGSPGQPKICPSLIVVRFYGPASPLGFRRIKLIFPTYAAFCL